MFTVQMTPDAVHTCLVWAAVGALVCIIGFIWDRNKKEGDEEPRGEVPRGRQEKS